jgi:hypothetical protein
MSGKCAYLVQLVVVIADGEMRALVATRGDARELKRTQMWVLLGERVLISCGS